MNDMTRPTQVRGEKLRDKIISAIRARANDAAAQGIDFVYNASEIARDLQIARSTLLRNDAVVSGTLAEIKAGRRLRDGTAAVEALKERNDALQDALEQKDREIDALHRHVADLYGRLLRHSVDVGALFRGYAVDASNKAGSCVLCGSAEIPSAGQSNVINIPRNREDTV